MAGRGHSEGFDKAVPRAPQDAEKILAGDVENP